VAVVGAVLLAGCAAEGTARVASSPTPTSTPSPTLPPLPPLDADAVARGREVYLQSCASCHGPNAEGAPNWQQPDVRGNLAPPPHDDSGHTWRHPDAQLAEIIRDGMRDPFNRTPELTMPPFQDRLSDQDVADVIAYFKSLWSDEHRRFQHQQNERPPIQTPGRGR
jgi:mono/diheme cytochrome c family protein